MSSWSITPDEHTWFTRFSGDANPIHDDPIAARRLLGGRMLAHGAHVLLRTLDQAAASGHLTAAPRSIRAVFRHGVAPGDALVTRFAIDGDTVTATVTGADAPDRVLVALTFENGDRVDRVDRLDPFQPDDQSADRPDHPRPLDLDALAALVGTPQPVFRPPVDTEGCRRRFPAATVLLGAGRISEVAAISFVVGMLTPGRSSMSSSYSIGWAEPVAPGPVVVDHTPLHVDARLGRVGIAVAGPSLRATVDAFWLPPPVDQRDVLVGARRPGPDEFAGWRALVVGASRGLGEATARLLLAGGAEVRMTWCAGEADGRRVADELGIVGSRWCAPDDDIDALTSAGWSPTHLCWFASPPTDDDPTADAIEIDAFALAVRSLATASLVGVLWPSTASDRSPRKAAGEQRCAELTAELSGPGNGVVVHAARLPTLLTDRTRSLLPRDYADTATELLAALRALAGRSPRST
jgi:hypothetical protein